MFTAAASNKDLHTTCSLSGNQRRRLPGAVEDIVVWELNSNSKVPKSLTHEDFQFRSSNLVPFMLKRRSTLTLNAAKRSMRRTREGRIAALRARFVSKLIGKLKSTHAQAASATAAAGLRRWLDRQRLSLIRVRLRAKLEGS